MDKDSPHLEQEPAPPASRRGALALAGAWGEVRDEDLDALIEDIYASRQRDTGRPVEIEA